VARLVITLAFAFGLPAVALAQQAPGEDARARFRFGPLSINPKLSIANFGVDTNVFNSPDDPFRDFTATVTPGADAWLRMNRAVLTSRTTTDWVHYQRAGSQRSFNLSQDWRLDVDLMHARPRMEGAYLRSRQRPNDEIDVRVQRKLVVAGAGVGVPIGSRVRLDFDARRSRFDFSQGTYGDQTIARALNRDSDQAGIRLETDLTPLTTFAVSGEMIRDRFVYSTERDSDSVRVMPGFRFQPFAVVSGSAFVGFRRFTTTSAGVPDYTGLVANVELKYVLLDMFRLTGQFKRDIDYSLDLNEPFFVSTSSSLEATQMIGLNWDVVARLKSGSLLYESGLAGNASRTDRIVVVGLGVGRRLGDELRVGFDVDHLRRSSAVGTRAFEGLRFGGSLTYGY
jgi:hypothetical protein